MKPTKVLPLLLLLWCLNTTAQDTFKAMFYNLLDFPSQEPATRIDNLNYILNSYQPDLFMVCELNNVDGANSILSAIQQSYNPDMAKAAFIYNTSDNSIGDYNDLQNLIFYDSNKFTLEYQDVIPSLYRDFNRYKLKLNTTNQDTTPIYLEVFVCHLKSSDGTYYQDLRKSMVDDLEAYLNNAANGIDANSYVILAGDFNLYTSAEPAFQELTNSANTVTFTDPANRVGSWHNNISYLDVFSQSTRTVSGLGGATGGFDDRFDFILASTSLQSDALLSYVPGSYQVYGNNNNSNCYNQAINSSSCDGTDFDFTLRNNLYYFSDHLPVTLQFQTSQTLGTPAIAYQDAISLPKGNVVGTTLTLSVNNSLINGRILNIYNTLGQKVKTFAVDGTTIMQKDIASLSNGIYYLTVENTNIKPIKFVKLH